MKIESINNSKVKEWAKLKEKKVRDKEGLFLVEGNHLVQEALKVGVVQELVVLDEIDGIDVPIYYVTKAIMNKLSSQVSGTNIIAICKKLESREIKGNVCLLDNIQDPGNLGTIIRSAVAFSIDTIVLSKDTVDLYNEKVIRASEGMIFKINFIKEDIKEMVQKLKQREYAIYGTDVQQGILAKKVSFSKKVGIILGNEGKGMHTHLRELCDDFIHIAISKECESLNVGVAASILFYELDR